jgi:hypothetical protein
MKSGRGSGRVASREAESTRREIIGAQDTYISPYRIQVVCK